MATSDTDTIRAVYERFAPTYDRSQWITEVFLLRRFRRRLISRVHCHARCQVLEVGIGTGVNLPYYPRNSVITGVDLSRPMLERALARAHRLGRQLNVEVMDAEKLPFGDGAFDTVVSTLTQCTTPDPLRLLGEMTRVCRPDGRILLFEHGLSTQGLINWVMHRLAPGHLCKYACHLIRDMAALPGQAGLKVLHMERHVFGIFILVEAAPR